MYVTSRGAPRTGLPFVLPLSFDKIDNNNNNNCKYSEISFQITNHVFKSQIKFSNHKSSAKSVCFQITYAKFTCDGPLGKNSKRVPTSI